MERQDYDVVIVGGAPAVTRLPYAARSSVTGRLRRVESDPRPDRHHDDHPTPEDYVYKRTARFAVNDASGARLGTIALPRGVRKQDPFFGNTEVCAGPFQVSLPIERDPGARAAFTVIVFYQGGNGRLGICYPPAQTRVSASMP